MRISFGTKVTRLWNINNSDGYKGEESLYSKELKQLNELQDTFEKNGRDKESLRLGLICDKGRDLYLVMLLDIIKNGDIKQANASIKLIPPEYQKEPEESLIQKGESLYKTLRKKVLREFENADDLPLKVNIVD